MPGFDRTGPEGQGPRTGRDMGKCNPKQQNPDKQENVSELVDLLSKFFGRGTGRGPGRGRGYGRGKW